MKKGLFVLSIFLVNSAAFSDIPTTTSTTTYSPFSGFYGTAALDFMNLSVKDIRTFRVFTPSGFDTTLLSTPQLNENTVAGGLALGYSNLINQFLWGIEGRGNIENLKIPFHTSNTEKNTNLNAPINTDIELKNDLALLFKVGIVADPRMLFYGLIGPQWGNFDISTNIGYNQNVGVQITSGAQVSRSNSDLGLLLGLGMEYLITCHMSLGLEYVHTDYGNLSFPDVISPLFIDGVAEPSSFIFVRNKMDAETNNVAIRLTYYFGDVFSL